LGLLVTTVAVGTAPSRADNVPLWPPTQLTNGGFESVKGHGPTGWTLSGPGQYSGSVAHGGTRSVSLVGGGGAWSASAVPSGPEGAYRAASAWFLTPQPSTPADNAHLAVSFRGANGAEVSSVSGSNVTGTCTAYYYSWAGKWCFNYFAVVVPAGVTSVVLSIVADSNNVSTWYVDDAAFGPLVSGAQALGTAFHNPKPMPAPGAAAVEVDATTVVRDIPRALFGDNAQYTSGSLPKVTDSPVVTGTIRKTSRPGILRFPGGNYVPFYDWEHPQDQAGCVNVNPVPATCPPPNAPSSSGVTDVDGLMRFARASGTSDILWSLNFTGRSPALSLQYTGDGGAATLTVGSRGLDVKLSGDQTDGSSSLHVDFARHRTVGDVIKVIAGTPGYRATLASQQVDRSGDPVLDELVHLTGADVRSAVTVDVDTGNIHKALRLIDYANNPKSTVVGPSGMTRDQSLRAHGLPAGTYHLRYFEVGNETYLIPGESGGMNPVGVARKVAAFAKAIHRYDKKLKVGVFFASMVSDGESSCCGSQGAQYVYNMVQAQIAGPYVDFVIDHPYENFHSTFDGVLAFPQHLARIHLVQWEKELFRRYSPDHRRNIGVFISEFDLIGYTTNAPSPVVSMNYQLVNALVVADEIGVLMTDGADETSRWDQLDFPNGSNQVWDDASGRHIAVQPGGYGLMFFSQHWGQKLLATTYRSPVYSMPAIDAVQRANTAPGGSADGFPWQTAYSSKSADGKHLYLMLINKSGTDPRVPTDQDMPLSTRITLRGFQPAPKAKVWTFNGTGRNAWSTEVSTLDVGGPGAVVYNPDAFGVTGPVEVSVNPSFSYTTPAHSITLIDLQRSDP
jgi:alpha-L-arabinofuranosidase